MDLELRLKKLEQTLARIKQTDPDKGSNIMSDYNDFMDDFHQLVVRPQSVSLLLEKARHYYLNEKEMLEMNVLFNAYCKIKANNLCNEDLRTANLQNYITGNSLTLTGLEQRLMALGWKG
ncbi:hypothetical protein [Halalkalibaculum sp. DA384]|uniref:hypothetical protein n=1 Tax=Halalkalibaculum sp. DA384 TaxID=3373606 RepID=UPI0037541465